MIHTYLHLPQPPPFWCQSSGAGQITLFEDLDRHRLAIEIALHFIATQQSELAQLFLALNALGHDVELQRVRQIDDGRDQCYSTRPGNYVVHERAVDLERVHRQLGQVAERRKSRAEVVDGDSDAQGPDRQQADNTMIDVLHDQAFGDFQLKARRRAGGNADGFLDLRDEASIAQLQRRHIHRDAHSGQARAAPTLVIFNRFVQGPSPYFMDQ